jgi:hypothetical protein
MEVRCEHSLPLTPTLHIRNLWPRLKEHGTRLSSPPGPWNWSRWGWVEQQPSGRFGCSQWWWSSCSRTWRSCSVTPLPLLASTLQVCPSHTPVSWLLPLNVRAVEGGQAGSQPYPYPLKLGLPPISFRTPPRPIPPRAPLLLISAPTLRIPTSWPGRRSSFTPYSSWGHLGPWVHPGGGGRSPDLTPPWPCPDSLPCPGPQSSQDSARRRALWPEVTDQSRCPHWLLGAASSSAHSASPSSPACCPPFPPDPPWPPALPARVGMLRGRGLGCGAWLCLWSHEA